MISRIVINRIRAAMWYVIDFHTRHGNDGGRTAAERALAVIPNNPTLAEALDALRVATTMARSATKQYQQTHNVACMTGHRIMRDLNVSAKTLRKLQENPNE